MSKKNWCCSQKNVCYFTSAPFDCKSKADWSETKKSWCCFHKGIGCKLDGTPASTFDCLNGLESWSATWTPAKQTWCCRHQRLGCGGFPLFDCHSGLGNWSLWSGPKKQWCCEQKQVNCQETTNMLNTALASVGGMAKTAAVSIVQGAASMIGTPLDAAWAPSPSAKGIASKPGPHMPSPELKYDLWPGVLHKVETVDRTISVFLLFAILVAVVVVWKGVSAYFREMRFIQTHCHTSNSLLRHQSHQPFLSLM